MTVKVEVRGYGLCLYGPVGVGERHTEGVKVCVKVLGSRVGVWLAAETAGE